MNKIKISASICLVLLSLFAAGCGPGQTPVATATLPPTASSTPLPTLTPTLIPTPTVTSTPAPTIGLLLRSDNWEATVLEAVYRKSITIAGTVYTTNTGYMGFDVILKVKNLNPTSNPSTFVKNDELVDAQGKSQLADCWSVMDVAKAQGKNLLDLPFIGCQTGNIYSMKISTESYLRFRFTIKDTNLGKTLTFKFEDLPAVPFIINK